jgi:chloramphenicol O-acetyltransferase type A
MRTIDISTWNRREHFGFFKTMAYPVYNICFDVDVTKVKEYTKEQGASFNLSMIHISTASLNAIDNFKYRLRGEQVVLHDLLTPSFAEIERGAELFKMITVPFDNNIKSFEKKARDKAKSQKEYFVLSDFAGRDDFVFYSAVPWISFTGVDHTINLKKEDAIPRISWGKYRENNGQLLLPYNIQVNHMFVDGIHLGMFKEQLDKRIAALA